MKWQEKLSLASLCLVLTGWDLEMSDNWPVLSCTSPQAIG
jgi:hypothetical protein